MDEGVIVPDHNAGRLYQAAFNAVIEAKVAYYPGKEGFGVIFLAGGRKGCGGKIITGKDFSGPVNTVKAAYPNGGFFLGFFKFL